MTSEPTRVGQVLVPVHCGHCGADTVRIQNVGGYSPAYCNRACAQAARRKRKRLGLTQAPEPPAERAVCDGCGELARLNRRQDFFVCPRCRGRVNSCLRKMVMESEQEAIDVASFSPLLTVYQCPLCHYWHMTSQGLVGSVDSDQALGVRLRAAGFTRTNFTTLESVRQQRADGSRSEVSTHE